MELLVVLALLAALLCVPELAARPPRWLRRAGDLVTGRDAPEPDDGGRQVVGADGAVDVTPSGGAAAGAAGGAAERAAGGGGAGADVAWGLFSPEFVRRRMAALDAELSRLDRDRQVFARAFHTIAAQTAYEALRAEERRLTGPAGSDRPAGPAGSALVRAGAGPARREELDL